MFVLSRDVSAAKKVIATLLATAMVLWASGAFSTAQAANIQNASDLLTDSAPGAASNHTVTFTLVSDLLNAETVVVDFDQTNGFDTTGVTIGDFAIVAGAGTFSEAINTTTDIITFTSTGGTVASGTAVTITIDGTNKITNPSSPTGGNESFEIDISAGTDTGHTRVVILDTVEVTASVDTVFEFTVHENGAGEAVNGTTTNGISSTTTIPFGTLVQYTPVIISQDLTVETNAINGFVVTVESDQALQSSTGADIDEFKDDVLVTNPEAWESPSVGLNIGDENTWGHWGITSEDATTTRAQEFDTNEWAGVTTTPIVIFSHDGPADDVTPGIGSTTIGYQVEISPLQEAADDYSTTLTYIATPTF